MDELWKKFSLTKLARTGSPEKDMTCMYTNTRAWLRATNKVHAFKRRTICTTSEIEIGCKVIHYHNI